MKEAKMALFRPRIEPPAVLRLSVAILATVCLFAPAAEAQVQSRTPDASGRSDRLMTIPEQKLDAAATALQKVVDLKDDYQRRLDAATDSERPGIADEAKGALAKAVTDQGLSVEEYVAIIVTAQNDPVVRERFLQRLPQPNAPPDK
jgi:hypothetical protein